MGHFSGGTTIAGFIAYHAGNLDSSSGGGAGVIKNYAASIVQIGTNAPIHNIRFNSIGTGVWSYVGAGVYRLTFPLNSLPNDKVIVLGLNGGTTGGIITANHIPLSDIIEIRSFSSVNNGGLEDDLIISCDIEIKIYR